MNRQGIISKVKTAYKLDNKLVNTLKKSKVFQILMNLPFTAECKHPEETAVKTIGVYLTAHKNQVFDEKPGDEFEDRCFDLISLYEDGKREVVEKGIKALQLLSLEDHKQDIETDEVECKYNPISAGVLKYQKVKEKLLREFQKVKNQVIDHIFYNKEMSNIWFRQEQELTFE